MKTVIFRAEVPDDFPVDETTTADMGLWTKGGKHIYHFVYDVPVLTRPTELPEFLYEDDGKIKIGFHGDSICTDEWNTWLEQIWGTRNEKEGTEKADSRTGG